MPKLYPDGGTANIGDKRWEVEWYVMRQGVKEKLEAGGDFDPDADQVAHVEYFPGDQRETARAFAQKMCDEWDKRGLTFAVVTVQEQVCEWFEEVYYMVQFVNVGETEYFDEPHEAAA